MCVESLPDVAVDRLDPATIETCIEALARSSTPVIVLSDDPAPQRLARPDSDPLHAGDA